MPRFVPPERLPYVTGVVGALLIAFSGIYVRLADAAPSTAAVFRCVYALPALAVLAAVERRRYGPRPWPDRKLALTAGVFFAADLTFWHHSIDFVGAGLATVLGNTQVALVGLIAWLVLGERPANRVLVAVPVVLVGVTLISGIVGEGAYGANPLLGVLFGVLTALAYSGFLLVLRQGNKDRRRPAGPLFDATLSAAVFAALAGWVVGDVNLVPAWPSHGWLLLLALGSQVVAWLLISVSLPRLPAVVTSIMLMLQPVGAMFLGVALLAEDPSVLQWLGVAVVLAGIMLATLGRSRREPPPAPIEGAPIGAGEVEPATTA